jgi:hypothetical protein
MCSEPVQIEEAASEFGFNLATRVDLVLFVSRDQAQLSV